MVRRDRHPGRAASHPHPTEGHRPSGRHAPPRTRHASGRRFGHLRFEVDLKHELPAPALPIVREIESFLRERRVEVRESLLELAAALLKSLHEHGFSRVDHWEVDPGGWLPLPEETHPGLTEPVAHLLRALKSEHWQEIALASGFLVRLSGGGNRRADAVLRRIHRERDHLLTLELWGRFSQAEAQRLIGTLRERMPVLRVQLVEATVL
jgi:hypothetical protein